MKKLLFMVVLVLGVSHTQAQCPVERVELVEEPARAIQIELEEPTVDPTIEPVVEIGSDFVPDLVDDSADDEI